jgi:hypothetical protein
MAFDITYEEQTVEVPVYSNHSCDRCGKTLKEACGATQYQLSGSLHLIASGGYGMFMDPCGGAVDPNFSICSDCVVEMGRFFPMFGLKIIDANNGHFCARVNDYRSRWAGDCCTLFCSKCHYSNDVVTYLETVSLSDVKDVYSARIVKCSHCDLTAPALWQKDGTVILEKWESLYGKPEDNYKFNLVESNLSEKDFRKIGGYEDRHLEKNSYYFERKKLINV